MIIKESNTTIMVKDMDVSVSFYQSIGFTVKNRWANYYAQLTVPGTTIGLHPTADSNLKGGSGNIAIGLTAADPEEARALLNTLQIPFSERQEEGGQFLHFSDPDGSALYFIKPKW